MPKYLYITQISDDETGEPICTIEAYSMESLAEQEHKIKGAIEKYEQENKLGE